MAEHEHAWCKCPEGGPCPCGQTVCAICGIDQEEDPNG